VPDHRLASLERAGGFWGIDKERSHIGNGKEAAKTGAAKVVPSSYAGSVKAAPSESSPWAFEILRLVHPNDLIQVNTGPSPNQ
jgi:hypothetical protein